MSEPVENVIWLNGAKAETLGVPVSQVCDAAKEVCEEVVIFGYRRGTGDLYAAASFAEHATERTVWLAEQAKKWLLEGCPDQAD